MRDMGARLGMLVVETIAKIRRAFFVQKKPIKAICREFRMSRKVVRKVIRSRATEFRYERGRQPLPRIDPWRDQLDGLLLEKEGKPARERLTLIRIFEELRALGYEGSYDAVRRYAKRWRAERGIATAEAGACPGEGVVSREFGEELGGRVVIEGSQAGAIVIGDEGVEIGIAFGMVDKAAMVGGTVLRHAVEVLGEA